MTLKGIPVFISRMIKLLFALKLKMETDQNARSTEEKMFEVPESGVTCGKPNLSKPKFVSSQGGPALTIESIDEDSPADKIQWAKGALAGPWSISEPSLTKLKQFVLESNQAQTKVNIEKTKICILSFQRL